MRTNKKLFVLSGAALAAGILLSGQRAEADRDADLAEVAVAESEAAVAEAEAGGEVTVLDTCEIRPGSLWIWDVESDICEHFFDDNRNWAAFSWSNRGDFFANDGTSHNVCIYDGAFCQGSRLFLPLGSNLIEERRNVISSNDWTTAGSCRTGC